MIQGQRCATLGAPVTVAATVAAAATRCPTVDLGTQLAVAPLVALPAVRAAVCQALVQEDARPVVKDLALPPSTSTITTWKTTTGPSLTSVRRTFYP